MGLTNNQKHIAQKFLELMKKDGLQWTHAWRQQRPPFNGLTNHTYQGMNYMTCAMRMYEYGWSDPRFITIKGVTQLGGSVKGHKATPIFFYGPMTFEDKNGEEQTTMRGRAFNVWNVKQLGLQDHPDLQPLPIAFQTSEISRNARIEHFIAKANINITQDSHAYYSERRDCIGIPDPSDFLSSANRTATESYYSVLLHEVVHWTGAEKRLNRIEFREYHKDKIQRAREELIAEIGSVFFGNMFNVQTLPNKDNAAYVQSWIKLLESNESAVFDAATAANRAMQYCAQYDILEKNAA